MSRFTDAMLEKNAWTKTTNGADARSSTGNPLVDMFGAIGSMRNVPDDEVIKKYVASYNFDKNLAMKLLFYARDTIEYYLIENFFILFHKMKNITF